MSCCHMNSGMVFLAGLNKAGYRIPHTLHSRALQHKVPFIMNFMKGMQIAPLAQALGPGTPVRRPNTIGSEWAPILKRSNVCMQRAPERLHRQRTRAGANLPA